jgi:hypothetical protein
MSWLGRFKLGDTVLVTCLADNVTVVNTAPAAPVLSVYSSAGTKVFSSPMPPLDPYGATGMFTCSVRLSSDFSEGHYAVAMSYHTSGSSPRLKTAIFQIVGSGAAGGNVISGHFYRRPHADHLILRTDASTRVLARNPYE